MSDPSYPLETPENTYSPNGASRTARLSEESLGDWRVEPGLTTSLETKSQKDVDIDRLYPTDSGNSALVRRIYKTLQSSLQHIDKARESLAADDFIDSDYHVTAVQGDLPELFCAGSISEGLRIFVVTLHYALTNRRGAPLTIEQISAIYLCLLRLKKMIFIRLEEALDLVDKLESVGLKTDPPEAAALNKLLLDESSS